MEFIVVKDDKYKDLTFKKVSKNGMVEIGVYRVLFGWRVRAGFTDRDSCELDWCAGGDWKDLERLYSLCYAILSKRDENYECFNGIPPHSQKKPFYLDKDFLEIVSKAAGDFKLIELLKEIDGN